jgi:hypothetical protein
MEPRDCARASGERVWIPVNESVAMDACLSNADNELIRTEWR